MDTPTTASTTATTAAPTTAQSADSSVLPAELVAAIEAVLMVAERPIEPRLLAQLVESTVMLVQWRRTPREVARQAVNRLESMGVKSVAGFVLSKVNTRKYAHSGYSASGALNYRNNARRRGRKLIGAQAEVAATVSQRH